MSKHTFSSSDRPLSKSIEEYGRGAVGGLLFSLPLLYTMEVWWAGFLADPLHLLAYMGMTILLLLGYNRFAGMRRDAGWVEIAMDSVEEMGIGLLLAGVVLYLMGQISAGMPVSEVVGKIVVESMTVAVGVSVGTAQLGVRTSDTGSAGGAQKADGDGAAEPPDPRAQVVLAFCGAVLFAANVAPTEEILLIAVESSTLKLLGLVALSFVCGGVIFFFSGFRGSDRHVRRDGWFWMAYGLVFSYAAALVASSMLLWFFGRFEDAPLLVVASQTVVLAFPAMLGASAGRLLIQ